MGIRNLKLIFDNSQRTYIRGERVTGKLLIQTDTPKNLRSIIIKFKGEAKVHWTETESDTDSNGNSSSRTVSYDGHEKYFENRNKVFGSNSGTETLPPGEHTFQFSMLLPTNIPSSFEGEYGHIRYTVKATLVRPWKFDHEVKAAFTVIAPVDLNLDPRNKVSPKLETDKYFCCCCCESGPLTLVTIFPASGFVSGQHVPIIVEVDNASNVAICGVVIELHQYIKFHSTSPRKTQKNHKRVKNLVLDGGVPEKDSKTWVKTFTIPPLPPSHLRDCKIIDLEYSMKVKAKPEGVHNDLIIKLPVTIGTIPLLEAQPRQGATLPVPDFMPMPLTSIHPPDMEGTSSSMPYPNIPPPSYEECMFGTRSIGDSDDNEHVLGITSYNPRYPTYNIQAPPPAYPGLSSAPPKY